MTGPSPGAHSARVDDGFLTLEAAAALTTQWSRAEQSLFVAVGAWVGDTDDPGVKVFFATQARRHGRNASVWQDVAPRVPAFTEETGASAGPLLTALGSLGSTPSRLAGYHEAATTLRSRYDVHRDRCSEVSDGPFAEVLDRLEASSRRATAEAERLLAALGEPGSHDDARRVVADAATAEWG